MKGFIKRTVSETSVQTAAIIGGKLLALVGTSAMPIVLARYLSKSDFGVYNQFYIIVGFCASFFSLGLHTNLYFFYSSSSSGKRKSIVFQTLVLLIISGLFSALLINTPFIGSLLIGQGQLYGFKSFVAFCVALMMPLNIVQPLFVLRKDNLTSILYPAINSLLKIVFIVVFINLFGGLKSAFYALIIVAAIGFLFVLFYTSKDIIPLTKKRGIIDIEVAKKQLAYSLPFGVAGSFRLLAQRFDKIMCITYLSTTEYAIYAVAFFGVPGMLQVYNSISQVSLVKMVKKHTENKDAEILVIYKNLVTKVFSFSVPAILIVGLFAEKIIVLLFTTKYIDSVPFFRVYLFSLIFSTLGADLILRATDNTKKILSSNVLSSLIALPSIFLLVKNFGAWGAMFGALIGIILPKLFNARKGILFMESTLFKFYPWRQIFMIIAISLISIVPFALVEFFYSPGILLTMILSIGYILMIVLLEIRYGLFVLQSSILNTRLNMIVKSKNRISSK